MANEVVVSIRNLSKSYTIAHDKENHSTLAEMLLSRLKHPLKRPATETFWALKEVSFEIKQGDVVGIIGRNGAGKSTLLKILSRITEPTSGEIDLFGKVGSLLEVGTGFHPELSGRENIALNGAILGMSKNDIKKQFDAIVDFAGIEKFLDTPVKRYSSGMYVRLAFAVAAHLRSDILIVDEVLAVGDAKFQSKCLGKMEEVGASGRTIFFVSHSMPMIQRLCRTGIFLQNGSVSFLGDASAAAAHYMQSGGTGSQQRVWHSLESAPGDSIAKLTSCCLLAEDGTPRNQFDVREPVFIAIEYHLLQSEPRALAAIHIINEAGIILFASADFAYPTRDTVSNNSSLIKTACKIPPNFLAEGQFNVLVALVSYNPNVVHAHESDALSFSIVDHSEGDGVRGNAANAWPGVVRPKLDWIDTHDLPTVPTSS